MDEQRPVCQQCFEEFEVGEGTERDRFCCDTCADEYERQASGEDDSDPA